MAGTLHLVATPIETWETWTARAAEVLGAVAFVVCEDTRHSGPWLRSLGSRPLLSLPAFAEKGRVGGILARLEAGEDGALVTDAWDPRISDPARRSSPRRWPAHPGGAGSGPERGHRRAGAPRGCHRGGSTSSASSRSGPDRTAVLDEVGTRATLSLRVARGWETLADLAAASVAAGLGARELTKVHEEFGGDAARARGALRRHCAARRGRGAGGGRSKPRGGRGRGPGGLEAGLARGERQALSTEVARQAGWASAEGTTGSQSRR
jgi:16S rRNA (cytidine1402-2'-O)-methyltransferase